MIDTHFHPQLLKSKHFPDCLDTAQKNGVNKAIAVSINPSDSPVLNHYAQIHSSLFFSVGIHPTSPDIGNIDYSFLEEYLKKPYCVALGETGLDYYHDISMKKEQQNSFRRHLDLSIKYSKPVIIHSRDAEDDTLSILSEFPQAKGVLHCFTGSLNMALKLIRMGYYISFSGILTFKNAAYLREIAVSLPETSLLVETDSPYLSPDHKLSKRSEVNLPHKVLYVCETLANIRQTTLKYMEQVTDLNANKLFNFPLKV